VRRFAVLAALLALTGCGGHQPSHASRDAVRSYISHVDQIEFRLRKQLAAVSRATANVSKARGTRTAAPALTRTRRTLIGMHDELQRVRPPADARKLHRLLLALVAQEASLAGELRDLSLFNPAFAAALRPLAAANASARSALTSTTKPATVAAAVRVYREAVASAASKVRALHPPPVERPLYDAQLQRLVGLEQSLAQLERAVQARDRTAVARAEHALSVASVSSDTRARQVAQRAAVLTYNARVRQVETLAQRVQRERDRLQRALP
jgi:hypothetical protein